MGDEGCGTISMSTNVCFGGGTKELKRLEWSRRKETIGWS